MADESASDGETSPLLIDFSEWTVLDDSFEERDNCVEKKNEELYGDVNKDSHSGMPKESLPSIPSVNLQSKDERTSKPHSQEQKNVDSKENVLHISRTSISKIDSPYGPITSSKAKSFELTTKSKSQTDCMNSLHPGKLKKGLKHAEFMNKGPVSSEASSSIKQVPHPKESGIPKKQVSVQETESSPKVNHVKGQSNKNLAPVKRLVPNVRVKQTHQTDGNILASPDKFKQEIQTTSKNGSTAKLTTENRSVNLNVTGKGKKNIITTNNQLLKNREQKRAESKLCGQTIKSLSPCDRGRDQELKVGCKEENGSKSLINVLSGNCQVLINSNGSPQQTTAIRNTTGSKADRKVKVKRFHRSCQTDIKRYSNKIIQCAAIQKKPQNIPPPKQCISVGTQSEEERHFDDSDSVATWIAPMPGTVSEEMFKLALEFKAVDSSTTDVTASEESKFKYRYGVRLGHLLPSDVAKPSFWNTLAKKADSFTLSFPSQVSGILDLGFCKEESLVNMINQIRKTRLGLRYLCLSISKVSEEKDENGNVPINCLTATVVLDQNFSSIDNLSCTNRSMGVKPSVNDYISLHNIPEGIPMSFLRLIFPEAVTIEMEDSSLKFTQQAQRVKIGLDRKNYPACFKNLFRQVVINDAPVFLTYGAKQEKEVPDMKAKIEQLKQQKMVEQKQRKDRESQTHQSDRIDDVIAKEKKSECSDVKRAKVSEDSKNKQNFGKMFGKCPTKDNVPLVKHEDVIDLTKEANSPLMDFSKELSDISDSSFDSDGLEGSIISFSEDEENTQCGPNKKSKSFNKLYEKYVMKSRKTARPRTAVGECDPKQKSSSPKGTALCGVTKDLLSSVKIDPEKIMRAREKFLRKRALERSGLTEMEKNRDNSRELNTVLQSSSSRKQLKINNSVKYSDLETPLKRKSVETMAQNDFKKCACSSLQKERRSVLPNGKVIENCPSPVDQPSRKRNLQKLRKIQKKGSLDENEGDLRVTLDNLRASQQVVQRKEGQKEPSPPVIRSFLSECKSQANRKRHSSGSSSSTSQRKVLLVRRPFSPIESCKDDTAEDCLNPIEKDSNLSLQFLNDKILTRSHHVEGKQHKSEDRFTVSRSFLIKLMSQVIRKDKQVGSSSLQSAGSDKNCNPNTHGQKKSGNESCTSTAQEALERSEAFIHHSRNDESQAKDADLNENKDCCVNTEPSRICINDKGVVKKQSSSGFPNRALTKGIMNKQSPLDGSKEVLKKEIAKKQSPLDSSKDALKKDIVKKQLPIEQASNEDIVKEQLPEDNLKVAPHLDVVKKQLPKDSPKVVPNQEDVKEQLLKDSLKVTPNSNVVKKQLPKESPKVSLNPDVVKKQLPKDNPKVTLNPDVVKKRFPKDILEQGINEDTVRKQSPNNGNNKLLSQDSLKKELPLHTFKQALNQDIVKNQSPLDSLKKPLNQDIVKRELPLDSSTKAPNQDVAKEPLPKGSLKQSLSQDTVNVLSPLDNLKQALSQGNVKKCLPLDFLKQILNGDIMKKQIPSDSSEQARSSVDMKGETTSQPAKVVEESAHSFSRNVNEQTHSGPTNNQSKRDLKSSDFTPFIPPPVLPSLLPRSAPAQNAEGAWQETSFVNKPVHDVMSMLTSEHVMHCKSIEIFAKKSSSCLPVSEPHTQCNSTEIFSKQPVSTSKCISTSKHDMQASSVESCAKKLQSDLLSMPVFEPDLKSNSLETFSNQPSSDPLDILDGVWKAPPSLDTTNHQSLAPSSSYNTPTPYDVSAQFPTPQNAPGLTDICKPLAPPSSSLLYNTSTPYDISAQFSVSSNASSHTSVSQSLVTPSSSLYNTPPSYNMTAQFPMPQNTPSHSAISQTPVTLSSSLYNTPSSYNMTAQFPISQSAQSYTAIGQMVVTQSSSSLFNTPSSYNMSAQFPMPQNAPSHTAISQTPVTLSSSLFNTPSSYNMSAQFPTLPNVHAGTSLTLQPPPMHPLPVPPPVPQPVVHIPVLPPPVQALPPEPPQTEIEAMPMSGMWHVPPAGPS